ncbi:MAG: DUF3791 domain-containing protein [Clostridium sp.]
MKKCNKKEIEFTVFIINKLSDYLKKPIKEVYRILEDNDVIDDYIIECYDVLHTQGGEYLVDDIAELLKERGVEI